jgi:syntaxin-binding protein 1
MTSINFERITPNLLKGTAYKTGACGRRLANDRCDSDGAKASVNTIKDMLAGLPEFQEGKERFGLHLDMAGKCVKVFQDHKLLDVGSVEQV